MMQGASTLSASDVTATVGFFLTLVGLIGTFFYVHLSNWLREILELKSKYDLNKVGDAPSRVQGRLECRIQLGRLLNHIPLLISFVLSLFICLVAHLAQTLIREANPQPAVIPYYTVAAEYFLWTYFALTLYLLAHGYILAFSVRSKLRKLSS